MAKELGFGEGYDAGRLGIIKAVHTAEVVATIRERNRIIKLLEGEKFILPEGVNEGLTLMPIQDAIALIKGEK